MVVGICHKAAVEFFEGIVESSIGHTYFSSLEISCIGPCLVPSGFPKQFVGLSRLALIFQCEAKIIYRLAILGVGVAFL